MSLNKLPDDVLLAIVLLIPLKEAVLLSTVDHTVSSKLWQKRSFWSSLFLKYRHRRAFKCPRYQDITELDIDALKDIILHSLHLDHRSLKAPKIHSFLPMGDCIDDRILFYVPGTEIVVTWTGSAICCWNRSAGTKLDTLEWNLQEPQAKYCSPFDMPGRTLFILYQTSEQCAFKLLQLDHDEAGGAKLSIAYHGFLGEGQDDEHLTFCVRPNAILAAYEDTLRVFNLATGLSHTFITDIPNDSAFDQVAAQIIDGHVQLFIEHGEGATLYVSKDSFEELVLDPVLQSGDEDDKHERTMFSVYPRWSPTHIHPTPPISREGLSELERHMRISESFSYSHEGMEVSPFTSRVVYAHKRDFHKSAVVTLWDRSHLPLDHNRDVGSCDNDNDGWDRMREFFDQDNDQRGVDIRLPDRDDFASVGVNIRASYWGNTVIAYFREQYDGAIFHMEVVRFRERSGKAEMAEEEEQRTDWAACSSTPLVIPDEAFNMEDVIDVLYDDSKGILMIMVDGKGMYCLDWA